MRPGSVRGVPARSPDKTFPRWARLFLDPDPLKYWSGVGGPSMSERSGFLDRAWKAQHAIEKRFNSIGKGRYARVLRMARKPEPEEYHHTSNVVLVGIAIVGGIGFAIFLFVTWLLRLMGA